MNPLISKYLEDVKVYENFLNNISPETWTYKSAPEKWSIHEILIHVTDSEVNGFVRLRKALAENGSAVVAYDQDKWAGEFNYAGQDKEDSLRLFRLIREMNHKLLLGLKENDWKKIYMHPEAGPVTVEKWLEIYVNHLDNHIKQMKKNLESIKQTV